MEYKEVECRLVDHGIREYKKFRELYTSLHQPQDIVFLKIRKKAIVQAEIVFFIGYHNFNVFNSSFSELYNSNFEFTSVTIRSCSHIGKSGI